MHQKTPTGLTVLINCHPTGDPTGGGEDSRLATFLSLLVALACIIAGDYKTWYLRWQTNKNTLELCVPPGAVACGKN